MCFLFNKDGTKPNVSPMYNQVSTTLSSFANSDHSHQYDTAFCHYLAMIEQCASKAQEIMNPKRKKKKGKGDKGKKRQPGLQDGRSDRNADDAVDGEAAESNQADDDNETGAHMDPSDDGEEVSDEIDPDMMDEQTLVDAFFETIPKRVSADAADKIQSDPLEVTDYKLWFVIYNNKDTNNQIRANDEGEYLNTRAIGFAKTQAERTKKGLKTAQAKPYEKWLEATKKSEIAMIGDNYLGKPYISDQLRSVESLPLSSRNNPACITNMYAPFWSFEGMSPNAVKQCKNINTYLKKEPDGTISLTFPLRKWVYRIPLSDMTASSLYTKIMPDYQQKTVNNFEKLLPAILADAELHEREIKETEIDDLTVARDGVDDRKTTKGNINNNSKTADNKKNDPAMDISEEQDQEERGLQGAAEAFGVIGYNPSAVKNRRVATLETIYSNQASLLSKLMTIPGVHAIYGSAYTPISLAGKRNIDRIRQDMSGKATSDGRGKISPWEKAYGITNTTLVARKFYIYNQDMVFREYETNCRSPKSGIHLLM